MPERTYHNKTGAARTITTSDGKCNVTVEPTARLTFDPTASNGPELDTLCQNAGFTRLA